MRCRDEYFLVRAMHTIITDCRDLDLNSAVAVTMIRRIRFHSVIGLRLDILPQLEGGSGFPKITDERAALVKNHLTLSI